MNNRDWINDSRMHVRLNELVDVDPNNCYIIGTIKELRNNFLSLKSNCTCHALKILAPSFETRSQIPNLSSAAMPHCPTGTNAQNPSQCRILRLGLHDILNVLVEEAIRRDIGE